jgi:hypothetical protein
MSRRSTTSHLNVGHLTEKIKAKRAAKGVNRESTLAAFAKISAAGLQRKMETERSKAMEKLHFSLILEDMEIDPADVFKKGGRELTVAEWKAYVRVRARTIEEGIDCEIGACILTATNQFHSIRADVFRESGYTHAIGETLDITGVSTVQWSPVLVWSRRCSPLRPSC